MKVKRPVIVVFVVGVVSTTVVRSIVESKTGVSCRISRKFRDEAQSVNSYLTTTVGWERPFVERVLLREDSRIYRCNCDDEWCEVAVVNGEFRIVKSWVEYPETIGLDRER